MTKVDKQLNNFQFQGGSRWQHVTNRVVVLESSHLLMLHEFERIALQKLALQKLNSSDLGVTTRIPKGLFSKLIAFLVQPALSNVWMFSDSSDKTKSRAYLLKKKVLPRWDSSRGKILFRDKSTYAYATLHALTRFRKVSA